MQFSGAVLAGGQSSRFGENKALFVYHKKPLIQWVLESLSQASDRFIIANQSLDLDVPIYADLKEGLGSLSGIHTALSYAKHDWVAIAACDLPFLTSAYWHYLQKYTNDNQIVIAQNQKGFPEPLAAFYHRSVLQIVERQIKNQDFTLINLTHSAKTQLIPWKEFEPHVESKLFLNANTKDDLPKDRIDL